MKMKMNGLDSAVFVAALLAATGLLADTKEWNGGASGDWNAAENWLPIGVPSSADDVTISSGTVLAVDAIDVASLDIGASATLFFGSTGTVAKAYATYPEAPAQRTFRVAGDLSCAGGLAVGDPIRKPVVRIVNRQHGQFHGLAAHRLRKRDADLCRQFVRERQTVPKAARRQTHDPPCRIDRGNHVDLILRGNGIRRDLRAIRAHPGELRKLARRQEADGRQSLVGRIRPGKMPP